MNNESRVEGIERREFIRYFVKGMFLIGSAWFFGAVAIYNIVDSFIRHEIIWQSMVKHIEDLQKTLLFLINGVITPCFLLSFLLYLLYNAYILFSVLKKRRNDSDGMRKQKFDKIK